MTVLVWFACGMNCVFLMLFAWGTLMLSSKVSYYRLEDNLPAFKKGKKYEGFMDETRKYVTMLNDMNSKHTYFIGSYFHKRDFDDLWVKV